jgi:aminoglycoside phosphotransferase (APT) family kinase protein
MVCVLHNDICPDHIFVDPANGMVVGLLDVSDAAWGDPALDFLILPLWLGGASVGRVLQSYDVPLDAGFEHRLRFLSRVKALKWLHDAILRDGDTAKHLQWVLNAFSF